MISTLLLSAVLMSAPQQGIGFTPTPQMRIDQVYGDMERNRAVRTPRTLYDYYPGLAPRPSYARPFDNYPPMFWDRPVYPYYQPYYQPYRPYYRPSPLPYYRPSYQPYHFHR